MQKLLRLLVLAIASIFFLTLVGCSNDYMPGDNLDGGAEIIVGGRKITYSVNLSMTAKNLAEVRKTIDGKAMEMGGYIEYSNDVYSENKIDSSVVVYRIPTESIYTLIDFIEEKGEVSSKNISTRDFTQSYVDAVAQKKSLESKKTMLTELLNDAEITASDKLTIINSLTTVEQQLQQIEIMISDYDSLADFSTIDVSLVTPTPVIELLMPFIVFIIVPGVVLGAIFIPRRIIKRKKAVNK